MTLRVSKVQTSPVSLFTVIISPPENASSTGLHDMHALVFSWPLCLHKFIPLWWFLFLQLLLKYYLSLGTLCGSLLILHSHCGDPTHGIPATDGFQISFEPRLLFRSSKGSMCLPAEHLYLYDPWVPQTQNVQHPYHLSPQIRTPFRIPLLSGRIFFPTWDIGVIWNISLFLAPKLFVHCVLSKL